MGGRGCGGCPIHTALPALSIVRNFAGVPVVAKSLENRSRIDTVRIADFHPILNCCRPFGTAEPIPEKTMVKLSSLKRVLASAVLASAFLAGAFLSAPAQALEPGDAIQTRKAVMASIGAHMNGIKAGMAAKNGKLIAGHAGAIAALAGTLPKLFPKGSGPKAGETRAKPEIWQQWDKFVETTKALQSEATELAEVAGEGDVAMAAPQFGEMARVGCGGCHRPFRAPKK